MARRKFTNLLALAVLSCLAEKPMHPYEISQTLRTRGKDQSIKLNYGALYSVVESLAKANFIEPRETVREGRRPERTVYAITPSGLEECESWLAELVGTPRREYHSLEAALSLVAGLRPDDVVRLLGERSVHLRSEIAGTEESITASREMGVPDLFLVETEFRLALLRAEHEFIVALAASIRDDTVGGVVTWRAMHDLQDQGVSLEEILSAPVEHLGKDGKILAALTGWPPEASQ
jgi:DNA-binding PadR family transcriptional regulator